MGKVGFGELAFWLVADAPADPVGDPGLRGGAGRAGRPRLHADRDRGPAHLPLRARLAAGRARRRPARRRVALPRRHRGLRRLPARRPRRPRRRLPDRRRRLGCGRARRRTPHARGRQVRPGPRPPGAQGPGPPDAGAHRDRRGGGPARPAPAAVRGDRPGARAGARPHAAAQRRRRLRCGPGRPRAAGRAAARVRPAGPGGRAARPARRGAAPPDRHGRLPRRRPQRGLRRPAA